MRIEIDNDKIKEQLLQVARGIGKAIVKELAARIADLSLFQT